MQQFPHDDPRHYAYQDEQNNMACRQVYFTEPGTLLPGHPCIDDNRILPFDGFIDVSSILALIEKHDIKPEKVEFERIWYAVRNPEEIDVIRNSRRFQDADTSFPGLISPVANPANKSYRMLDGRRRMWKLMDEGQTDGWFTIVPPAMVYRFFWMILPKGGAAQGSIRNQP